MLVIVFSLSHLLLKVELRFLNQLGFFESKAGVFKDSIAQGILWVECDLRRVIVLLAKPHLAC